MYVILNPRPCITHVNQVRIYGFKLHLNILQVLDFPEIGTGKKNTLGLYV